jgi:hypothetical protein
VAAGAGAALDAAVDVVTSVAEAEVCGAVDVAPSESGCSSTEVEPEGSGEIELTTAAARGRIESDRPIVTTAQAMTPITAAEVDSTSRARM